MQIDATVLIAPLYEDPPAKTNNWFLLLRFFGAQSFRLFFGDVCVVKRRNIEERLFGAFCEHVETTLFLSRLRCKCFLKFA
jgi:hypothetical protein